MAGGYPGNSVYDSDAPFYHQKEIETFDRLTKAKTLDSNEDEVELLIAFTYCYKNGGVTVTWIDTEPSAGFFTSEDFLEEAKEMIKNELHTRKIDFEL